MPPGSSFCPLRRLAATGAQELGQAPLLGGAVPVSTRWRFAESLEGDTVKCVEIKGQEMFFRSEGKRPPRAKRPEAVVGQRFGEATSGLELH